MRTKKKKSKKKKTKRKKSRTTQRRISRKINLKRENENAHSHRRCFCFRCAIVLQSPMINDSKISAMSLTGNSVGCRLSTLSRFWFFASFFFSEIVSRFSIPLFVCGKAGLVGLMLDNSSCFASASTIRIWRSSAEHPTKKKTSEEKWHSRAKHATSTICFNFDFWKSFLNPTVFPSSLCARKIYAFVFLFLQNKIFI